MEAVGVGASVVTFITLGLQSIKFIDEALSLAKDGKGYVDRARRDVQSLQAALERFGRCRAVAQNPQPALAAMIQSCADDMKTIAGKLHGLVVDDSQPSLAKQLRKIKIFLKEKDLERMSETIVRHTTALDLYLGTIDR